MPTPQPESPNLLILILFGFLLKVLFDFKLMGGLNYSFINKTTLYDNDSFGDSYTFAPRRFEEGSKAGKN